MSKTIFGIVALLVAAAFYWSTASTSQVNAQRSAADQAETSRWEYCSVVVNNARRSEMGVDTVTATVSFARSSGTVAETIEHSAERSGTNNYKIYSDVVNKTMAMLGDQGWEMVSQAHPITPSGSDQRVLYFKRRAR